MNNKLEICKKVVEASNTYERCNTKLKKEYIKKNIDLFNEIAKKVEGFKGSFGTGYPFYALRGDFLGDLPVIGEQIRYNNELLNHIESSNKTTWLCENCLIENGANMPDLKQICKICPNMDDNLKPRKIINRLPDIDMWLVCSKENIQNVKNMLISLYKLYNFSTSDINPIKTINDLVEISDDLKNGRFPNKNLPIDTHVIEYFDLAQLISEVPNKLHEALINNSVPYLPILPYSYRKKWQKDDSAYNFIHDFLSSLTEFDFEPNLKKILIETRKIITSNFSTNELYKFLLLSGPESVKRRHQTTDTKNILKLRFEERIKTWKK